MRQQYLYLAIMMTTGMVSWAHADFKDDANVQLKFRNFYLDRQIDQPDPTKTQDFGSWTQGVILDAKSGYSQWGAVQVGVDVLAQYAVRLSGDRQADDYILPFENGHQAQDFGKVGLTLKAKVAQTEIKVGEILPNTPVVTFDPSRQLLTTYEGVWLESKDLDKTKLTLAYLDGINARYENQVHDFNLWPRPLNTPLSKENEGMYIAGIDYQATQTFGLSYFYADVTNIYRQNYLGLSYNKKINEQNKVATHIRYFDNTESGDAVYGAIDNQALSLKAVWTHDVHSVDAGYQQMFGEHGNNSAFFPTLSGWVPQPYLSNWSVASFIRKDEKSWSLGYSYDFKNVGLQGLTATVRHYDGWNIANSDGTQGKENENNLIVNYVVPEGKWKGLGFQYMLIDVNYHDVPGFVDLIEHRVALNYSYRF